MDKQTLHRIEKLQQLDWAIVRFIAEIENTKTGIDESVLSGTRQYLQHRREEIKAELASI